MGLLSRMGNVVKGLFGKAVNEIEGKNVDALLTNIENEIDKHKREAEEQVITVLTSSEKIKMELNKADKDLQAIIGKKNSAINMQDEELLIEILMMEQEAEANYNRVKADYEIAQTNIKRIKEDHKLYETEMRAKKREIESMRSEAKMAQLKETMNTINAEIVGNSSSGKLKNDLDRARDLVEGKSARANAVESLNNDSIDMKLKRLDANVSRENALAKAKELLGKNQSENTLNN